MSLNKDVLAMYGNVLVQDSLETRIHISDTVYIHLDL